MKEFLQAAISPLNLTFTILVGLMVLYWIFVIVGAFDMDVDMDADWMPDVDIDDPGILTSILQFLSIGQIPVMVIISFLITFGWCFSMLGNYYFNKSQSFLIGAGLLVPNLIISLLLTSTIARALHKVFGPLHDEDKEDQQILYRVGVVVSGEVNPTFGQVEIQTKGSPLLINARTTGDLVLKKGEKVLIYEQEPEKGIYLIERFEE